MDERAGAPDGGDPGDPGGAPGGEDDDLAAKEEELTQDGEVEPDPAISDRPRTPRLNLGDDSVDSDVAATRASPMLAATRPSQTRPTTRPCSQAFRTGAHTPVV